MEVKGNNLLSQVNASPKIRFLLGVVICVFISFLALMLVEQFVWLKNSGLSLLTVAILLGIAVGNLPFCPALSEFSSGIQFVKQRILRTGIILYGLRLTFQDIGHVGFLGASIDLAICISTFSLAVYFGVKHLKLDKETAILIGAGSAICGAAAILATEPVVNAKNEKVAVAIATVVLFGTISIFSYPFLYQIGHHYFSTIDFPSQFGIYIGSTIHEVAQVLAAANSVGSNTADIAVIAKMMRVMMLIPFLLALSVFYNFLDKRKLAISNSDAAGNNLGLSNLGSSIPWFAFLFVMVIALNSLGLFPRDSIQHLVEIDNFMLATAMAALGLSTKLSEIKDAGLKPLFLAFILFLWLVFGGAFINVVFTVLSNSLSTN